MRRRYKGPVAWINHGEPGLDVPESGFYALTKNGREVAQPFKRLVAVQHKNSTAHHYVVAKPDEHSPPIGNVIEFEFEGEGTGNFEA